MDSRMRASLDRYITGNYGEDQFDYSGEEELRQPECRDCGYYKKRRCQKNGAWIKQPRSMPCGEFIDAFALWSKEMCEEAI